MTEHHTLYSGGDCLQVSVYLADSKSPMLKTNANYLTLLLLYY